jgi:hypothetical protein
MIQSRIKNVTTLRVTHMIMDGASPGVGAVTRDSGDLTRIKRHLGVIGLHLARAVRRNHDWCQRNHKRGITTAESTTGESTTGESTTAGSTTAESATGMMMEAMMRCQT